MSTASAAAIQRNPFPGLRPFREDEEYVFFGRESQVDAMVNKLAATHFLAVVGTSGSGKSSLVNCGLRPALHGGLMARAGTQWRMAQFRPGSDPLRAMAHALAQDGVLFRDYQAGGLTLPEIVETTLRMSKLGLIDIYEQAQLGEDVNLLVVVDQFEELFRYRQLGTGPDEKVAGFSEAATAFVSLLLEAKEQTTFPICVVLTMRSDFLGDCAQFPGLAEAINAGQYLVPRMTRDERRAAISGPARVGGAEIAPVLLTRLVNDVGDNPDQLSILQHALNRTWARWQHDGGGDGPLVLAHYQAIGTMAHALDQHAEKAYAELGTARQHQICEKIFKALTDKATDPRGIRRPTTLGTLCALADAAEAEVTEMIDVFRKPSRSFLMPPAGEVLGTETVIDISHESLMRVWRRLNTWADEESQSAQTYRRLAETAALHAAGKASLWRDPDLQLALDWRHQSQPNETWAARYHPGFATGMGFLTESSNVREAERAADLAARKRDRRRRRIITWGFAAAALIMGVLAVNMHKQRQLADEQRQQADEQRQQAESALKFTFYMGDQLKGLEKPFVLENLGRNLNAFVAGREDNVARRVGTKAHYFEGLAALERADTSADLDEAVRALLKFEIYRTAIENAANKEGKGAWLQERGSAQQALGDTAQILATKSSESTKRKFDHLLKKYPALGRFSEYFPDGATATEPSRFCGLRDESYAAALEAFKASYERQEETKSEDAVLALAGIYTRLGDIASLEDLPQEAISSFVDAQALSEAHRDLNLGRMREELMRISSRIYELLHKYPEIPSPDGFRWDLAVVNDFLRRSEGPDPERVLPLYADRVDYYSWKSASKKQILDDKRSYFKRWPEIHYTLIDDVDVEDLNQTLRFRIQYDTFNRERGDTRSGTTENTLQVRKVARHRWVIVSEKQDKYIRE